MLKVEKLIKKFDEKVAVNDVSFEVPNGKVLGILGRNGAGKSTIFRIILNIIEKTSGNVRYNGSEITDNSTDKIGYLPEEGSLILTFTVLEQCIYYGALKSMSETDIQVELLKWLKRFDIVEYMNMKIKDLSKGNRQKIQFIIALLHNPDLVILDEPFSGLDPISVESLKEIIIELKNEGKTIIFSSHRMDHVEMLCDDILIIEKGNTVLSGNLKEIKAGYNSRNIKIKGNISDSVKLGIEKIDGVIHVIQDSNNIEIKVENSDITVKVFDVIRHSDISNFSTTDITLNDIFIDKVGRNYEE